MSKIRKQVYIEPHQELLLKSLCKQTGNSEAELIRQAIDNHLAQRGGDREFISSRDHLTAWESETIFISEHRQRAPSPGKRDWSREDLYER
ncbi:hypothetical protein [Synechococcus sp. PCC 7336]|uniref:hypothetical protein n=1 Tax=Synechococcus sp. PCC 7336 TaxID=195250 RepID=UPI00034BD9B1|nr:hypothetical protein [Synechococcus sp. PCC 7336]